MRRFVPVLALLFFLFPTQAIAIDYRSDNYQVVVDPQIGTPFSSEPALMEIEGPGTTSVFFEYDNLIPSNYATPPLTANHQLITNFYLSGSIYLVSNHRPQDENGLALPKWTDKNSYGLGYHINQNRRYQPLPSRVDLEEPVIIGSGNNRTTIHLLVNYPTSKRDFIYQTKLKYFVVPSL